MTLAVVLFVGYILWSSDGGDEYISHLVCRLMLWRAGSMPLNYRRFLDYAAERILFRKVGDVYVFTHRLLRDYFASVGSTLDEKEKAIAVYDQAIALDPDNADAYYRRGNAYYKLNEYKKSIADYEKAIALDPDYAQAYYRRGNAYQALHKYDAIKDEYEKAIADYERAIADYEKAIALNPDYKSDQSLILNYLYVFDHLPSPQHSALQKELMLIWSRRARSRL